MESSCTIAKCPDAEKVMVGRLTGSQENQKSGKTWLVQCNKQIPFVELIFSDETLESQLLFKRWLQIVLAARLRQCERAESSRCGL